MQQIFGRAGRPQFEDTGLGIIITVSISFTLESESGPCFVHMKYPASLLHQRLCLSCFRLLFSLRYSHNKLAHVLGMLTHQLPYSVQAPSLLSNHGLQTMVLFGLQAHDKLAHYLGMLTHQLPIESQFVRGLVDNLNAEIVLGAQPNASALKCSFLSRPGQFLQSAQSRLPEMFPGLLHAPACGLAPVCTLCCTSSAVHVVTVRSLVTLAHTLLKGEQAVTGHVLSGRGFCPSALTTCDVSCACVRRHGDEREGGEHVAVLHIPVRAHDAEPAAVRRHLAGARRRPSPRRPQVLLSIPINSCGAFREVRGSLPRCSAVLRLPAAFDERSVPWRDCPRPWGAMLLP